jgi:hypothetical protein
MTAAWLPGGDYARKSNTGFRCTSEPLIFTGADDLEFQDGWLAAARAKLTPGVGVVGTNDLGSPRVMAGLHATHFLFTRRYVNDFGTIDGPGQVMTEAYVHEWVDDEVVGTAKSRGAWAFAEDSRVKHLHPNWDATIPIDQLYAKQHHRMRLSRLTYERRSTQWT